MPTTCAFVSITPSGRTMTPEPEPPSCCDTLTTAGDTCRAIRTTFCSSAPNGAAGWANVVYCCAHAGLIASRVTVPAVSPKPAPTARPSASVNVCFMDDPPVR
jgi:hypothetical protein